MTGLPQWSLTLCYQIHHTEVLKTDADRLGGKDNLRSTLCSNFKDDPEFKMIPWVKDGQLLFLANNIAKMKHGTELEAE